MNTRVKMSLMGLWMMGVGSATFGQPIDSVVIRVGNESKVIFMIKDKRDLETLKHYNFQALMEDMVQKLEKRDSTAITKPSSAYLKDSVQKVTAVNTSENWQTSSDQEEDDDRYESRRHRGRRTHHSFNIDLGTNNYLENGKFPDASNPLYTVKPWGSWYVGLNSVLRTRIAGKFFLEWGGGVSWYNFKFSNEKTVITKDDNGVIFTEDPRPFDFRKSKLTASYLNAFLVPMIDFGSNSRKSTFFDGSHSNSFRIGAGPYAGYRIDSYTKQMYYENGDKTKSHNHDNYYMNNIRYGLRLQIGFRDTDLFFNYDMNELFSEGKGPKLNAFSFGITL